MGVDAHCRWRAWSLCVSVCVCVVFLRVRVQGPRVRASSSPPEQQNNKEQRVHHIARYHTLQGLCVCVVGFRNSTHTATHETHTRHAHTHEMNVTAGGQRIRLRSKQAARARVCLPIAEYTHAYICMCMRVYKVTRSANICVCALARMNVCCFSAFFTERFLLHASCPLPPFSCLASLCVCVVSSLV